MIMETKKIKMRKKTFINHLPINNKMNKFNSNNTPENTLMMKKKIYLQILLILIKGIKS